MSNATKTLSAVFVGLLVLTGLTEWLGSPSASEAFQRTVVTLDTAEVQTLVVDEPGDTAPIRLSRSADGWTVTRGTDGTPYPASRSAVERALETLSTLQANAVVTRQSSKYARFEVDSTGTAVTAVDADGDALAELVVGRSSFANRRPNTYVRPVGDPSVYEVGGVLTSRLGKDVEGWREKRVWRLVRRAVTQIDFEYPADSAFSMQRVMADSASAWVSAGDTLRPGTVGQLLDELATLDATGFAENLTPDTFGEARYTLRLHFDGGAQRVLRLRPSDEEAEAGYYATASDYPYVFEVRRSTWDDRVLKSRADLLRTAN